LAFKTYKCLAEGGQVSGERLAPSWTFHAMRSDEGHSAAFADEPLRSLLRVSTEGGA